MKEFWDGLLQLGIRVVAVIEKASERVDAPDEESKLRLSLEERRIATEEKRLDFDIRLRQVELDQKEADLAQTRVITEKLKTAEGFEVDDYDYQGRPLWKASKVEATEN